MRNMRPAVLLVALLLQGCAAGVIAVGAGVTADTATDNRTIGTQIDDKTLSIKASQALIEHKQLWTQSNLSTIALEGKVLVIGQTPTPVDRQQIATILKGVTGVKAVINEVRLGQPESLATQAQDTWITTKIKTQMYTDKGIAPGTLKVITENSEVFLIGVVTQTQADNAVAVARNVSGVSKVIKFFKIIAPPKAS